MSHQNLKKALRNSLIVILFGWFFGLQVPWEEGSGATVRMLIGPFSMQPVCQAELEKMKAVLGEHVQIRDCFFIEEA